MRHSDIILNHRVCLPGTHAREAVHGYKLGYISTRIGVDASLTEDDLMSERLQPQLDNLGYIAHRKGAVADPKTGCALFGQNGPVDFNQARRELKTNSAAAITSVLAVRRERAHQLQLESKQDFERFLRAHWRDHVASMGIMRPEDVRWYAAYHENSDKNWHAHIVTWDNSGKFNCLIPRGPMEKARRDLVSKAVEPARQKVSLERTQARDTLVEKMRDAALDKKQQKLALQIASQLPRQGSLKYATLQRNHPEIATKVDELVAKRVSSDPELRRQISMYRQAVEQHADLKGLKGKPREAHIQAAELDLINRMGNAQIRQIREAPRTPIADSDHGAVAPTADIASIAAQIAQAIAKGSPQQQTRNNGPKHEHERVHRKKYKDQLTPKANGHKRGLTL